MNLTAGEAATVTVPLTLHGEPFVPDSNQIHWALRGHVGSSVVASTLLTGVTNSFANIALSAPNLPLGSEARELRTLIVTGTVGGVVFSIRKSFHISGFLNYSVTEQDVRTFIGITESELPDTEIDLVEAYFDLSDQVDIDAFVGTEAQQRLANKALVAQTVINLLPGLPQLLSKKDEDGTSAVERFTPDFEALARRAHQVRDAAVNSFRTTEVADVILIAVATRIDPFTGV